MTERGDGVWSRAGIGDGEGCRKGLFTEADVFDLVINGRFEELSVCSNIPIKDVVGGIDLVSNTGSESALPLLIEGGFCSKLASFRRVLFREVAFW